MNTQNRVFKKLAQAEKTELATQKVELASTIKWYKDFGQKNANIKMQY